MTTLKDIETHTAEYRSMRPIGQNQKIRVLVNGIGVYCLVRDIASREILDIIQEMNDIRSTGQSCIGLLRGINKTSDNKHLYVQVDVV